jgi:hypothetical protein
LNFSSSQVDSLRVPLDHSLIQHSIYRPQVFHLQYSSSIKSVEVVTTVSMRAMAEIGIAEKRSLFVIPTSFLSRNQEMLIAFSMIGWRYGPRRFPPLRTSYLDSVGGLVSNKGTATATNFIDKTHISQQRFSVFCVSSLATLFPAEGIHIFHKRRNSRLYASG